MRHTTFLLAALLSTASGAWGGEWKAAPLGDPAAEGAFRRPTPTTLELGGATGYAACTPVAGDAEWVFRMVAATGRIAFEVAPDDGTEAASRVFSQRIDPSDLEGKPHFLRVLVQGRHVAFHEGADGVRWLNRMGGRTLRGDAPLTLRLRLEAKAGEHASARVEVVRERATLDLGYTTAWFGNTLPGSVHDTVSFNMSSLAVAPDGTCYTTSFFEEQGHCLAAYREGRQVYPDEKTPAAGKAVALSDDAVFAASERGVLRLDRTLGGRPLRMDLETAKDYKGHEAVRGLAAADGDVYASYRAAGEIVVLDAATLTRKRSIPCARTGAMAVDGPALWAVRENFATNVYERPYAERGVVLKLDRESGRELARIADLEVPTGLCVDRSTGTPRLLVAENGPDQQVRVYDIAGTPRFVGAIGRKGGLMAAKGVVDELAFNGLTGVGVDAKGNVHVSQTGWPFQYVAAGLMANATRLVALPAAAGDANPALWSLDSLGYIFDGATLDPRDPTSAIAGADQRYRLDWGTKGRIGEWVGYLTDHPRFSEEASGRRTRCSPFVRWIDGQRFLLLVGDFLHVYRFEPASGELAIPCAVVCAAADYKSPPAFPQAAPEGRSRQPWVWQDGAGGPRDGVAQAGEYRVWDSVDANGSPRYLPDARGDLWQTGWYRNEVVRWRLTGLKDGVPGWEREAPITDVEPLATVQWAFYDPETDTMVLAGDHREYPGSNDVRGKTTTVARYREWLKGNRKAETWFPFCKGGDGPYFMDGAMGMSLLGDLLYVGARPGNVSVYDLNCGNRVIEFVAGPEVNGTAGYFDRDQSAVQVFALPEREQVALCQENGWCRILAYRWRPDRTAQTPPPLAPELEAITAPGGALLRWRTPVSGFLDGYRVERAPAAEGPWTPLGEELAPTPTFQDRDVADGTRAWYRVAAVNTAGPGPFCAPVAGLSLTAAAAFVGEDAATQGDWRGTYGATAWWVDGDDSPTNPKNPDWLRFEGGKLRKFAGHASTVANEPWRPLTTAAGSTERRTAFAGSAFQNKRQRWLFELGDGDTHALTLYFAGHNNGHGERIELVDALTGAILDTREAAARGPGQGRHLTWNARGRFEVRIVKLEKAFGCPLAAIFLDPPREKPAR